MPLSVSIEDVRSAADRLAGVAHRTPVLTSSQLDAAAGGSAAEKPARSRRSVQLLFKCENFQRVGAFKFRGAYNALSRLSDEQKRRGVLTYSSGNHAQAVALASRLLGDGGIGATVVMPSDAPAVKLAATRAYLAQRPVPGEGGVVVYDRARTTREELGARLAEERGLTVIPPYDHPDVIAGQGTVALEFFEQAREMGEELDALFVPCGGGGLLSGCATVARAVRPACRVIGVEPEAGDDATRSFRTKTLQRVKDPPTIADGARTPSLGRYTFPIVLERVDEMMTVSDAEIVAAMRLVWERMKIIVEPTGVLGVAAALKRGAEHGRTIGVVLSGGNVDVGQIGTIFSA